MTERLQSWMERMESKVDDLRTDMASLKAMRSRIEEHIEADEHLFHGNGSPGLIKDVDRLKQWRGNLRWIIAAVLIPGVAAAAELVRSLWVSK